MRLLFALRSATGRGSGVCLRPFNGSTIVQSLRRNQRGSHAGSRLLVALASAGLVMPALDSESPSDDPVVPATSSTSPPKLADVSIIQARGSFLHWLRRLLGVVGTDAIWIVVAGAVGVAAVALGIIAPQLLASFWDAYSDHTSLLIPALKLAAVVAGRFVLQWLSSTVLVSATESAAARLRDHIFTSLLEQDMAFFDSHEVADLVGLLTDDVKELRDAVRSLVGEGLPSVTHCVGTIASLFASSPTLTGGIAVVLPMMLAIGNLYAQRLRSLSRRNQELQAKTAGIATESLNNIRTVRAFTGEQQELIKYNASQAESSAASMHVGSEISTFRGVVTLGLSALGGGILWLGGNQVQNGSMTSGELASFLMQAFSLEKSLEGLSNIYSRTLRAQGTFERVAVQLDTEPVTNTAGGKRWPNLIGDISFDNVWFAYPSRPDTPVLQGVSLKIPAGKVVALCGPSGSGKSTVASLLLRFYAPKSQNPKMNSVSGASDTASKVPTSSESSPTSGDIFIDGRSLSEVDVKWYRESVAYVTQDPSMFNTSIRDNIRYGNHDASDEELIAAAKGANAWEFISKFPLGLDTRVGERGTALSGGQRQRIALARALLRNPKILILDEYSSALDAETESVVQTALAEKFKGRTVLIIAHRLSTIAAADVIYVMNKGSVVESGSHANLMQQDGAYARLVKRQHVHHEGESAGAYQKEITIE